MTEHRGRALDALRGTSALAVVVGHTSYQLRESTGSGPAWLVVAHLGSVVYLFFALSGYLIARPWLRALISDEPLPRWRTYTVRRIARICPLYYVTLLIILALQPTQWATVAIHAVFLQDVVAGQNTDLHMGVMWTLGIEATYYVCVPLIATLIRHFHSRPIAAQSLARWILLSGVLSAAFFYEVPNEWREIFPAVWCFFTPGLLVVIAEAADWRMPHKWPALVSGGLLWIIGLLISESAPEITAPIYAGASGLWLTAAIKSRQGAVLLPLSGLGIISYGTYLIHAQLLERLPVFDHVTALTYSLAATELLTASAILASFSWYVLERPILRRAHRSGLSHRDKRAR